MTGQTGQTGQGVEGGILAQLSARFAPPSPPVVPPPVAKEPERKVEESHPSSAADWDEARAQELQAAVQARVDQAMREIPVGHPRRQARLNVLAREPAICRALAERRDPTLWGWLDSLEHLLDRWRGET